MSAKHCEWCGELAPKFLYRFIIEPDYVVFFNSPFVSNIDKSKRLVYLKNGNTVEYSVQVAPTMAVYYKEVLPHIFCSDSCENSFITKYGLPYTDDLPNKTAVISFKENGYYAPMVISTQNMSHDVHVCKHCNSDFPNLTKKYNAIKIINKKIQAANKKTNPDMQNYPVVFSDMYDGKNSGNYYLFAIDLNQSNWVNHQFCSNECAFEYSVKHDVLLMFKNNILEGKLTAISPYTKLINEGLENPYKYRPQKFNM